MWETEGKLRGGKQRQQQQQLNICHKIASPAIKFLQSEFLPFFFK